jgi:hypothetical protein
MISTARPFHAAKVSGSAGLARADRGGDVGLRGILRELDISDHI